MPIRTEVDATTTSGGGTTVEGKVIDEGPGGLVGYVCDVMILIDGDKLQWVGPSTPSDKRFREDKAAIHVWWREVPITKEGVDFEVPVEWKATAMGLALVTIVAFDDTQKVISHDVLWMKKPRRAALPEKAPKALEVKTIERPKPKPKPLKK